MNQIDTFTILGIFLGFVAGPICYNVFRILYDNWKESKIDQTNYDQRLYDYNDVCNRILWNISERQTDEVVN